MPGRQKSPKGGKSRRQVPLEPPGRAHTDRLAHHQAQVEAGDMNQDAFENVRMVAQMGASHRAGLVAVGEAAFDQLATTALETLTLGSAHPTSIGVRRVSFRALAFPVASSSLRLRDIGANAELPEAPEHGVAVVPLVGNQLRGQLVAELVCRLRVVQHLAQVVDDFLQQILHRLRVAGVAESSRTLRTAPVSISTACPAL